MSTNYIPANQLTDAQCRRIAQDALRYRDAKTTPAHWPSIKAVEAPRRYIVEHRVPKVGESFFGQEWGHSGIYPARIVDQAARPVIVADITDQEPF